MGWRRRGGQGWRLLRLERKLRWSGAIALARDELGRGGRGRWWLERCTLCGGGQVWGGVRRALSWSRSPPDLCPATLPNSAPRSLPNLQVCRASPEFMPNPARLPSSAPISLPNPASLSRFLPNLQVRRAFCPTPQVCSRFSGFSCPTCKFAKLLRSFRPTCKLVELAPPPRSLNHRPHS